MDPEQSLHMARMQGRKRMTQNVPPLLYSHSLTLKHKPFMTVSLSEMLFQRQEKTILIIQGRIKKNPTNFSNDVKAMRMLKPSRTIFPISREPQKLNASENT